MRCIDCAESLTAEERYYYDGRCERCESAWSERSGKWMRGEIVEPELDAMFSARPKK